MRHPVVEHPRPGAGRRRILNTDEHGPDVNQAGELRSARVESLRAIAALAVLEGHVYGVSVGFGATAYRTWLHRALLGGGFGVYLFFSLSGYLLFLPFARRSFGAGRSVDLARYARNRALRILPLYYAVALTYLLVLRAPGIDWAAYLLFGENFSRRTVAQVDGPMWSLVVEVMFYVLLPFLAFVLARVSRRSVPAAAGWLVALAVAAGAYRWVAYLHAPHPGPLVQYNLPANFFFFLPGMLLALAKVASESRGPDPAPAPKPIPALLRDSRLWVAASAALWAMVFYRYQWDLLAGVASFLLLGACVLPLRPSAAVRMLGWRPLALLGTASYSLYLWHLPIVTHLGPEPLGGYVGHLLVDAAVCMTVALASYAVIEAPFLRWRKRWGDTASGSTPVAVP